MAQWSPTLELDRSGHVPLYLQIVRATVADIRRGRLRPGEALPGTRSLAGILGVNRTTTLSAYQELEAEGWITSEPDRGSFVSSRLPLFPEEEEPSIAASDSGSWTAPTPLTEPFFRPRATDREGFRLIPDLPDVRLAPAAALHRAGGRVLNLQQQRLLQPGWDPRGLLDLRISLGRLLREMRGLALDPGNLVLTRGLMSTLTLVSRTLFGPGDLVAVEDPAYFRVLESFRAAGARLAPVPVDRDGLDLDALEGLLAQEPIRLLYTTTSPHHPTHAVLSAPRRRRLLDLARTHRFRILEGDPSLGFQRETAPSLPLASEDTDGSVVYFSGLEQILAPGLQVGFLAGFAPLIKEMAKQRQLIDWPGNQVQEATIEELFRDGEITRHLARIRKVNEARRAHLVDRLLFHLHPHIQVEDPREGLSLWVKLDPRLPVDAWTERCAARGVIFYPGRLYDFHRRALPALALGFAAHDEAEQHEACARMAEALEGLLPAR